MSYEHVFIDFINTQLHEYDHTSRRSRCKWANKTWIVLVQPPMIKVMKNDPGGRHAEVKMIDYLRSTLCKKGRLSSTTTWTIKFFINHSPCGDCSVKLMKFMDEAHQDYNVKIQMEMIFSALYNIYRHSCRTAGERGCTHKRTHMEYNAVGIRDLIRRDVSIGPFCPHDWQDLAQFLDSERIAEDNRYACARKKEDAFMLSDFRFLFEEDIRQQEQKERSRMRRPLESGRSQPADDLPSPAKMPR